MIVQLSTAYTDKTDGHARC